MAQYILVGCDLHEKSMLVMIAADRGTPVRRTFPNTSYGRQRLIAELQRRAQETGAERIVFAYEASSLGLQLYDELTEAGIACHVLAPTKLARSAHQRRRKTDEKDALTILDAVRAHVLAGAALPAAWVPDPSTRADRSLVRLRLRVGEDLARLKTQTQAFLKTYGLKRPQGVESWTQKHWAWLGRLAAGREGALSESARWTLESLLRQIRMTEAELARLDTRLAQLAHRPRYAQAAERLREFTGVGTLIAMVFLTELGEMSRFRNRRQVAAYLGLAPSCHESGERQDRKGHITRQGPATVRKVLCQAVWVRMGCHEPTRAFFAQLAKRAPQRKKIYVVAHMRKLAIRLWHAALDAQAGRAGEPSGSAPRRSPATSR